jgi:hypothetical protein
MIEGEGVAGRQGGGVTREPIPERTNERTVKHDSKCSGNGTGERPCIMNQGQQVHCETGKLNERNGPAQQMRHRMRRALVVQQQAENNHTNKRNRRRGHDSKHGRPERWCRQMLPADIKKPRTTLRKADNGRTIGKA